jgi:hypothetical protein
MIIPPTKSFFVLHITGEAADFITNKFSPEVTSDIREAVLISDDFDTDFEAHTSMDCAMNVFAKQLKKDRIKTQTETLHNPLYIPSTPEELDSVLGEEDGDNFRFIGFGGNPFTMKSVEITSNDRQLLAGRVACHEFDLPSYTEILQAQERKVIN